MIKYDIYAYGHLDDCPHLKGINISSSYCTQVCKYCSDLISSEKRNSFNCNFIEMSRKEKLKKLKSHEKR